MRDRPKLDAINYGVLQQEVGHLSVKVGTLNQRITNMAQNQLGRQEGPSILDFHAFSKWEQANRPKQISIPKSNSFRRQN